MSDLLNPPFLIAILVALTVHEWAHAFVADRLGDPTPRAAGRLTLNPLAHLDPLGTLLFFFVRFGWGKPVPVNPRYFHRVKRDSALVAIAGPLSNIAIALLAYIVLAFFTSDATGGAMVGRGLSFFLEVLMNLLFMNLALFAFNLLPIAPLDGSKVLHAFIPLHYEDAYERFMRHGPMILLSVLIAERVLGIPILATWMTVVVRALLGVFGIVA